MSKLLCKALADYHFSCVKYNKLAYPLGKLYHFTNKRLLPLLATKKSGACRGQTAKIKQLAEFSISRTYAVSVSPSTTQPALKGYVIIDLLTYKRPIPDHLFAVPLAISYSTPSSELDLKPHFAIEVFFVRELNKGLRKKPLSVTPLSNGIVIWNPPVDFPEVILPELKKLLLHEIKNYQKSNPKFMDQLYPERNWRHELLYFIQ